MTNSDFIAAVVPVVGETVHKILSAVLDDFTFVLLVEVKDMSNSCSNVHPDDMIEMLRDAANAMEQGKGTAKVYEITKEEDK